MAQRRKLIALRLEQRPSARDYRFIYVVQWQLYFYRLPLREWLDICEASQREGWENYELPENRRLKRRPRCIVALKEDDNRSFVAWPQVIVEPLDWEPANFADWLELHREGTDAVTKTKKESTR
jgi:hypothetical protein